MSGSRNPDERDFLPSAALATLRLRAEILALIREFFRTRGVLEVETPVLCHAGVVDPHLDPIPASYHAGAPGAAEPLFLVTSPEHNMKRLLAAGSGPIYQITRAFRDGERGRLHNPEFTILEWYRPGMDPEALMDEVEDLTRAVVRRLAREGAAPELERAAAERFERVTYRDAFRRALAVDPFTSPVEELSGLAVARGAAAGPAGDSDRDAWLNVLLVSGVERTLGRDRPAFLLDYPPSQAALARVRDGDPPVAERFELYIRGIELANGYHELSDPREQERRFVEANRAREAAGKGPLPLDGRLLRALEEGLPDCSGVALGLDRLLLVALGRATLDEVLAFPLERA